MQRTKSVLFFLIAAVALSSCGLKKAAVTVLGSLATDGTVVIESEEDLELARNSTPSLIVTLEVFAKGNPKNKRLAALISRSYGQYAFGFLEEDMIRFASDNDAYNKAFDRALLFYQRGLKYGLSALWPGKSPDEISSMPFDQFEKKVSRFGRGNVPALFWTAFSWGNLINMRKDDPASFIDLPRVEALIQRVIKLNPDYYYGSAHSFIASILASRPPMLGGNPALAGEEFEKAIKCEDKYLMTKVLYAQYYAVQVQDLSLFEGLLNKVISSNASTLPEQRLANELAKRRAALLLSNKKKYF